ncbi:MAG: glycosyltransferase, partial [Micrococcus sp.]|nr:glycosyltransferase [Micrococcus sp.]
GPEYAALAALMLLDRGTDVTLDVFGDGELTESLQHLTRRHAEAIRFHGSLPYEPDWNQIVRDGIDLMVLPHIQGDPSGTYLESAALGVPVVGFDNRALRSLVARHGIGWTVPLGDVAKLTDSITELVRDPERRICAGRVARSFMQQHTIEAEFSRRITHLRGIAGC